MPTLSKSKIIAFRQCPKRLWLEVHRRELRQDSPAAQARFQVGYQVGDIARRLYDPTGKGAIIDVGTEGFPAALARSAQLLQNGDQPVFEAGFQTDRTTAFADVMLPVRKQGKISWKMIEVKSSSKLKDYHRDDAAVQAHLARKMGVRLSSVAVAHIDGKWTYPGSGDYRGLLTEHDLTAATLERTTEIEGWIRDAHKVADQSKEPKIETGDHCYQPFECGFCEYCNRGKTQPEYPVTWLPRLMPKLKRQLKELGIVDMRHVPENLLSQKQKLVRGHTIKGTTFFDRKAAKETLAAHGFPGYFLDFETIALTVPIWAGTNPNQKIPFQFSLHKVGKKLEMEHLEFLDLSGEDPSERFAQAVVKACGRSGPVYVYNAAFEKTILSSLAKRFPDLSSGINGIIKRVIDLLPVAKRCFYHPSQCGSWSIKKVLPAAVPELSYDNLNGVKDGGMAMEAYSEAVDPKATAERKAKIRRELLDYCRLDTRAMVELWAKFLFEGKGSS